MKTKIELLRENEELKNKISVLEDEVEYWQKEFNEVEEIKEELEEKLEDIQSIEGINNIDNFIWKLKQDNLFNNKLEDFINDYLKYDNV